MGGDISVYFQFTIKNGNAEGDWILEEGAMQRAMQRAYKN